MIIFPKHIEATDLKEYCSKHFQKLEEMTDKLQIFQYWYDGEGESEVDKSEELSAQVAEQTQFHEHAFKIFNRYPNIKEDTKKCRDIENTLNGQ